MFFKPQFIFYLIIFTYNQKRKKEDCINNIFLLYFIFIIIFSCLNNILFIFFLKVILFNGKVFIFVCIYNYNIEVILFL